MKCKVMSLVFMFLLVGCASNPYGNYSDAPSAYNQHMAVDTVNQLMRVHPPALTHVVIEQPTRDRYGKALISSLRAQGYAVTEYSPARSSRRPAQHSLPDATYAERVLLQYVVDQEESSSLYYVTVTIAEDRLSRVYTVQNDQLVPIGAWMHKESSHV